MSTRHRTVGVWPFRPSSRSLAKVAITVTFFCLFLFLINCLAPTAIATQTTASIGITPALHVARMIGEDYIFTVNIIGVNNLHALQFTIVFNASTLQFCSLTQGSFFPPSPASSLQYGTVGLSGLLTVNMSLANTQSPLSGNGTLISCVFAVIKKPSGSIVSTLVFSEAIMVDSSGNQISCDSNGGVCFWNSLVSDPPGQGLLIENSNRDMFAPGDSVTLVSQVTYGGDPVRNKLVAFQILDPFSNTIIIGVVTTDQNGMASISFRLPEIGPTLGEWTAFSTVELDQAVYWDSITFQVNIPRTVGGSSFALAMRSRTDESVAYLAFFALSSLALIVRKSRPRFRRA